MPEAEERLIALLGYVKEVAKLHAKPGAERLRLSAGKDEGSFVLHEGTLRRLQELRGADDRPFVELLEPSEHEAWCGDAAWMRVRRPEGDERKGALGQQVCAVYAMLFTAHQEALREGRGAQLTAGVGIVRWQLDGCTPIEHPLVLIPAELVLDGSGDFVVRLADAAHATIWTFPGLPQVVAARLQLEACAKDYRLLGGAALAPTDRPRWEPLLRRAAHCLSADGAYIDGPPPTVAKGGALAGPLDGRPRVYNGFALWTQDDAGERGLTADCDALAQQLRQLQPGALPAALARLVGLFDGPPRPSPAPGSADGGGARGGLLRGIFSSLVSGSGAGGSAGGGSCDEPPFLYFGLPSNGAQQEVVGTLQRHGCAILVGPPGTGKSQTIANVICHYLATGRRVLVTSKGEPATEVLRSKLPPGLRELCVSLGSGDSSSFRRLEASVEYLADTVAASRLDRLAAESARLRSRVAAISAELRAHEAAEERWAAPHFPPQPPADGGGGAGAERGGGACGLPLHAEHLACLGLAPAGAEAGPRQVTLTQLADTVTTVLGPADAAFAHGSPPPCLGARGRAEQPPAPAERLLCSRAFFLQGVALDPLRPPPAEALLDEIRLTRARAAEALVWGESLRAAAPAAEAIGPSELAALGALLAEGAALEAATARGELPRLRSAPDGAALEAALQALGEALRRLEAECARHAASQAGADDGGWLLGLLRHADSPAARRAFSGAARLARRLCEVGGAAECGELVSLPPVLLRLAHAASPAVLSALAQAASADCSLPGLLGESELAAEVRWRAAPEQRSLLARLRRSALGGPSETLSAALLEVRLGDRPPATAREWQAVQARLELSACEAALRGQWAALAAFASAPPLPLPAALPPHAHGPAAALGAWVRAALAGRLAAAGEALECAAGLGAAAACALADDGEPAGPPPLGGDGGEPRAAPAHDWARRLSAAPAASSAECAAALAHVRAALRLRGPELAAARAQQASLLREIGRAEPPARALTGGPSGAEALSPLGGLRAAIERLADVNGSADAAVSRVLGAQGRLREARASLGHLQTLASLAKGLRAPAWAAQLLRPDPPPTAARGSGGACPPDARRVYAAAAAMAALRGADRRDTAAARGASVAQRLSGELEAAVCELAAAAAKEALRRGMCAATCAGLMRIVSAVGQAGAAQADSARAARLRQDLASALTSCAQSVPCWIMPTWRVSQTLPAAVASFDLVVIDEASQSDVTALPALLRGAALLVVGDGKQVSPSDAFVSEARVAELRASLRACRHPFAEQLLPGRSVFDLAQVCYADARVALRQHFRCVPACIAFSNERFYHGRLQPCRLPPRSQRLVPPLVDVRVPGGCRSAKAKTNEAEARALVSYLAAALAEPAGELRGASVGVISLGGLEQARLLRALLLGALSDAQLARHRVLVGDASSFQGDERDVVLLSMVSSKGCSPPQLGRAYEQKYNVALSRARDRLVLFRSLGAEDVPNAHDCKRWAIAAFQPRPAPLPRDAPPRAGGAAALTPEGQLRVWLTERGFRFGTDCAVGGSAAVVEDAADDRRLCVCLDGGVGCTLAEWRECVREQRTLERAGWRFCRIWRASWLVDRPLALERLSRALDEAGVRPAAQAEARTEAAGAPSVAAAGAAGAADAPPPATQKVPRGRPAVRAQPGAATAGEGAQSSGKKRKAPAGATAAPAGGAGDVPMPPANGVSPASAVQPASTAKQPRQERGAQRAPAVQPPAHTEPAAGSRRASPAPKLPKPKAGRRGDNSDSDWEP